MRREWMICGLLAGLTLAVYWPAHLYSFVDFDDPVIVTENPRVSEGLNWQNVRSAFTTPVIANWHPVTTLSHALDCQLFGVKPGPQHMVNIALHTINAVLLFVVLRLLTSSVWRSGFVAAIFAVHPLRVESVAWISERKDVLSGFFFMLTLWAYARYVKSKVQSPKSKVKDEAEHPLFFINPPSSILYLLALLFFALGLMSKPMLVTLPFLLLLLDYWPIERFQPKINDSTLKTSAPSSILYPPSSLAGLVIEKLPFIAMSVSVSIITFVLQSNAGATSGLGLGQGVGNAVVSYLRYLGKMVWPTKLAVIYPHPFSRFYGPERSLPMWEICTAGLFLLAITAGCVWLARPGRESTEGRFPRSDAPHCNARQDCAPYFVTGWFWYLGMMVPVIGLIQVGEQAMADRYTYLPSIGVTICLVWGVWDFWAQTSAKSNVQSLKSQAIGLGMIGSAVVAILGFASSRQLSYWQNTVTLFEHTVAVTSPNPSAEFGLGIGLEKMGHTDQALVHYRRAAAIDPKDKRFHYNLGQLLRKQERWQEAADEYQIVLALEPKDLDSLLNLASMLTRLGRPEEAKNYYDEALQHDPNSTEALNNLAWLLATSDQHELRDGARAVQLAESACQLTGFKTAIMVGTLAAAYAEAGRFAEAVATAQKACELAEKSGEPQLLAKNQQLLQLYKEGKPARER